MKALFVIIIAFALAALAIACSDISEPVMPIYEGTWAGTVLDKPMIITMTGPPYYSTVIYYSDKSNPEYGKGWHQTSNDGKRIFAINYIGTIRYEYVISGSSMTGPFYISTNDVDTTVQATFTRGE